MRKILELADTTSFNESGSTEGYLLVTAFDNAVGYKRHEIRYLAEVALMLFLFIYVLPDFLFFGIIIFIAVFINTSLNTAEAIDYAFFDIVGLTNGIRKLIKDNPKKCKKFIMENENQEIKDLIKLYNYILESDGK